MSNRSNDSSPVEVAVQDNETGKASVIEASFRDADMKVGIKRICKDIDIQEVLHDAVEDHKKRKKAWWKQPAITTVFLLVAWILYDIAKPFLPLP